LSHAGLSLVWLSWMTFAPDPVDLRTFEEPRSAVGLAAPSAVRHQSGRVGGWSVTETTNFRLHHRQAPVLAEQAALVAEQTRVACCHRWFGVVDGDWSLRCDVYLHATGGDYWRATGVAAQVPGHSTTDCREGRVTVRRIDLHCDVDNLLTAILPHEVTHAVMVGKFGDQPLPHWANEALAVLTEPAEIQAIHLRDLPRYRREGKLFALAHLVRLRDYPPASYLRAFHAQSVSLVQMLAEERGPQVFAEFLRDGLRLDFETALKVHYGCDLATLEQRWHQYAFGGMNQSPPR
jgi:hypothetical protein